MYKLVLILKYLRRKLAPLFAAVAVTLCTAMVIIVMSVMGGFLDQFRLSARNLTADIVVSGQYEGFPGYEQLLEKVQALPEIEVGTPGIEAAGLINFGDNAYFVRIHGIDMAKVEQIVGYHKTLLWNSEQIFEHLGLGDDAPAWRQALREPFLRPDPIDPGPDVGRPETVIGVEVNPYHYRDDTGQYNIDRSAVGRPITLTVVPLTESGTVGSQEPSRKEFLVVNEFKSGLYDIDGQHVFVPFETLQNMLRMNERKGDTQIDPETGMAIGDEQAVIPGRANQLMFKVAPGVPVEQARLAVQSQINTLYASNLFAAPRAATWEEVHGQFLGAVQNEKGLVTFLFAIISVVAIVMVATTFYMIVLEKTRDIGVLRAIGASRRGILGLYLGYGLAIGVVGSLLGLALAVSIVTHLNEIQNLLDAWFGWRMWDPQTYFFDKIPDTVNYAEAMRVVLGAILSSVIGATLPALLAARLKPVEALRYE